MFLEAVHTADFEKSTHILSKATISGTLSLFVEKIQEEIETQNQSPLPIRDHVFNFIDIPSMYNSINIPSYDILQKFIDYRDSQKVQEAVFEWVVSLIENESPVFFHFVLEIEDLTDTDFVTTIPDILTRRIEELDTIHVPFSTVTAGDSTRTRYFVKPLQYTAYGRQLLLVMGTNIQSTVVGQSGWSDIKDALNDLGYDNDTLLKSVDEEEWLQLTSSRGIKNGEKTNSESIELVALQKCQTAYLELDSPQLRIRLNALDSIESLGTRAGNRKIMNIARDGSTSEQVRAIRIIAATGSSGEEAFLSELVNQCNADVRTHVANGLSQMVSRGFALSGVKSRGSKPLEVRARKRLRTTDDSLEKLDAVLRSPDRNARIDAARALALMNSSEAEQLLYKLAKDSDPRVRLEVVELTPSLSRDFAVVIMRSALEDDSTAVRSSAIQIGKRFWPEQDWPEM